MGKFIVGDIVVGNEKANAYGITREGVEGTVVDVENESIIRIVVDGHSYSVEADYFDLVKRTMEKFHPGDIIIGNHNARGEYSITTEGTKCIVIENGRNNEITVRVLDHEYARYIGIEFYVDADKFDLVSRYKPLVGEHVRIKEFAKRPSVWNIDGKMDKYMGTIQTVIKVDDEYCEGFYIAAAVHENDNEGWVFSYADADPVFDEEFEKRFKYQEEVKEKDTILYQIIERKGVKYVRRESDGVEAKLQREEEESIIDAAEVAIKDLNVISCSAVCIKSECDWWTVGKIYKIENGLIADNDGDVYRHIISIDSLNANSPAKFLQIVE